MRGGEQLVYLRGSFTGCRCRLSAASARSAGTGGGGAVPRCTRQPETMEVRRAATRPRWRQQETRCPRQSATLRAEQERLRAVPSSGRAGPITVPPAASGDGTAPVSGVGLLPRREAPPQTAPARGRQGGAISAFLPRPQPLPPSPPLPLARRCPVGGSAETRLVTSCRPVDVSKHRERILPARRWCHVLAAAADPSIRRGPVAFISGCSGRHQRQTAAPAPRGHTAIINTVGGPVSSAALSVLHVGQTNCLPKHRLSA